MDFWLVLSKNDSNNICSSIKNKSFLKIWRVWHILKVCHALWYLKIEMGIAGSIFELQPPNFQKMCIFWRCTNDIFIIFCYLLRFQFCKKCQSLPVHSRVVPGLGNLASKSSLIVLALYRIFFGFQDHGAIDWAPLIENPLCFVQKTFPKLCFPVITRNAGIKF